MTGQEADKQIEAATDAIRATQRQLLREGQVHPQVIILALATALGEFAAGQLWPPGSTLGRCRTISRLWCARSCASIT